PCWWNASPRGLRSVPHPPARKCLTGASDHDNTTYYVLIIRIRREEMHSEEPMLRIGIIGTGSIASAHIKAYLAFPEEVEVVGLADIVPCKAARAAAESGRVGGAAYDDPRAMIAEGGLDLVSIATPPSTQAALAVAALDAGVHVLVEKPMAP